MSEKLNDIIFTTLAKYNEGDKSNDTLHFVEYTGEDGGESVIVPITTQTTYDEITSIINGNKIPVLVDNNEVLFYTCKSSSAYAFSNSSPELNGLTITNHRTRFALCNNSSGWSSITSQPVQMKLGTSNKLSPSYIDQTTQKMVTQEQINGWNIKSAIKFTGDIQSLNVNNYNLGDVAIINSGIEKGCMYQLLNAESGALYGEWQFNQTINKPASTLTDINLSFTCGTQEFTHIHFAKYPSTNYDSMFYSPSSRGREVDDNGNSDNAAYLWGFSGFTWSTQAEFSPNNRVINLGNIAQTLPAAQETWFKANATYTGSIDKVWAKVYDPSN